MAPETNPPAAPPVQDTEQARARLRIPLLVALILSAAAAFFVQPRVIAAVRAETLPALALVIAPGAFAIVVVIAALDAWRLARRRGYFRGPSVVMLAAGVAFLGLLLPSTFDEYRARTSPPASSIALDQQLFESHDPRVRALVMEAVGFGPENDDVAVPLLKRGLADEDPMVVAAAKKALLHRLGAAPVAE
jgi:hypothetical protein